MNINLLSPTNSNNGFSYNVRFRENVKFSPKSKVYLNYATFTRENEISFTEDQTITLTDIKMLPEKKPSTPATVNEPATKSVTIPAINPDTGEQGYTFDALQKIIGEKLQSLTSQNELKIYTAFNEKTALDLKERDVGIGYYVDPLSSDNIGLAEFEADTNNKRHAGSDIDNAYFKNSATGAGNNFGYDNYALSNTHFFHPLTECEEYADESTVYIETNKAVSAQTGGICFGLYSREYTADAVGDSNTNRTQGINDFTPAGNSNPQVVTSSSSTISVGVAGYSVATPAMFLSVEITPRASTNAGTSRGILDGSVILRIAKKTAARADNITSWTDINENIAGMMRIYNIKASNLVGTGNLDNTIKLMIKTYYKVDSNLTTNNRKLHFKLINLSQNMNVDDPANLLYDSKNHDIHIPFKFFNGLPVNGTASEQASILNSQIPFNILATAQVQNEGFSNIQYTEFDKSLGTNDNPLSILMDYKIGLSSELAGYAGSASSNDLWANSCEFKSNYVHIPNFNLDWQNDSYSILLKNLPIKNFKNTGKQANGGFGKAIIANVPSPFRDSIEQILGNKKVITGIFQPNYPVELDLDNNEFELNNFDVSIVNMRDETEVKELIKSNISFTILKSNV